MSNIAHHRDDAPGLTGIFVNVRPPEGSGGPSYPAYWWPHAHKPVWSVMMRGWQCSDCGRYIGPGIDELIRGALPT